jgi:hypothetical protein
MRKVPLDLSTAVVAAQAFDDRLDLLRTRTRIRRRPLQARIVTRDRRA